MKKMRLTLLTLLTAAAIAASVGCASDKTTPSNPAYTKLAFHSDRTVSPATNLFLMNLDGTGVTPVPFSNTSVYSPSNSADLTTIGFESMGNYWVSNASGSTQTQLVNAGAGFAIRVAPNGKKLLLNTVNSVTMEYNLWIMNVDGTGGLDLTPTVPAGMSNCYIGSFSPDSTKIVMNCSGSSLSGIYTINPDGTGLATVITQSGFVDTPAFTPDGSKILFISYILTGASSYGIVSVNPDGSNLAVLANGPYELEILNSSLFYTLYDSVSGNYSIYKANLDGTGAVALTDGTTSDYLGISTD
jgi:Tol biopolymer transport system component